MKLNKIKLKRLEEGISQVRKTQIPTWFHDIQTPEEISLIRQAKREHHPVFAELSGEALMNKDDDAFWSAIDDGIIDRISYVSDLESFLKAAVEQFLVSPEKVEEIITID